MAVEILPGDCVASMRCIPAGTVQTCVTSPPYYGLRDYGVAGQIGLEDTPDQYIARMVEVFREVRRVLRDDGTAWLNIGDSYASPTKGTGGTNSFQGTNNVGSLFGARRVGMGDAKQKDLLGIPWMLAFALRADGWYLRSAIVWAKPNPMPESVRDRPTSAYEMVFLLTKQARYFYDAEAVREEAEYGFSPMPKGAMYSAVGDATKNPSRGGRTVTPGDGGTRNARNVWTIATQPYSGAHFAAMPPDLAERCIRAGTSEKGQCPHCGAAWERVQTLTAPDGRSVTVQGIARTADADGRPLVGDNMIDAGTRGSFNAKNGVLSRTTTGWSPSCDCPAHAPVPQHVLDPFGGAGTTGLVADRLGRHATLCELNPTYAALARERITADAPLLAAMA